MVLQKSHFLIGFMITNGVVLYLRHYKKNKQTHINNCMLSNFFGSVIFYFSTYNYYLNKKKYNSINYFVGHNYLIIILTLNKNKLIKYNKNKINKNTSHPAAQYYRNNICSIIEYDQQIRAPNHCIFN